MRTDLFILTVRAVVIMLLPAVTALAAPAGSSYLCEVGGKLVVKGRCNGSSVRLVRRDDLIGPQGPTGAPGPISGTLPSGVTLRGFYSLTAFAPGAAFGSGDAVYHTTISYGFSLGSAPTPHYIAVGGTPPAECPGNVGQPEASPGHLCVYEDGRLNVATATLATTAGENTSADFGAIISAIPTAGNSNLAVQGTWAVTAP